MITSENISKTIEKDIQKIEKQLHHKKIYNIRNLLITSLLKSGIALDYARPFILAGVIFAYLHTQYRTNSFEINEIPEYASVMSTKTSNGFERKLSSFDITYSEESFKHSTAWTINELGLYERTVTSYKVKFKKYSSPEILLDMTKEEIDKILEVTDIEIVQKNELEEEDFFYNEDIFILVESYIDKEQILMHTETKKEHLQELIFYWMITGLGGAFITEAERRNLLLKSYPKDFFRKCIPQFRIITNKEQTILEKELKIKRQNLDMLNEDTKSFSQEEVKVLKREVISHAK